MHKICQRITLYNPGLTGFLLKEDEARTKCGGMINLLFVVLVDDARNFTFCSQLVTYPRVSTKHRIRCMYNSISSI